jgi:hypothetical protein
MAPGVARCGKTRPAPLVISIAQDIKDPLARALKWRWACQLAPGPYV